METTRCLVADYQMKESGYESSSGRFRANGWVRPAAIFPSDVDEDDRQSASLTLGEQQPGRDSGGKSRTFTQKGARCSSVVRAFAHGAMGRRIDPSWGGPIELFLVPASAP